MSRSAVLVFGFAAGPAGFGCGNQCRTPSCPTAHVDLHALADSTVTWMFQDGSPETSTGFVPDPPSGNDCSFTFLKGAVAPAASVPNADADVIFPGSATVSCAGGGSGGFEFVVTPPGDMREWSTGTFTLVVPDADTKEVVGTASGCQVGYLIGLTMTATVEEAVGGTAPYPKLVTDDFLRTFRLDFDTSTVMPKDYLGHACDFPLTGKGSLHLTQTAADYVGDPGYHCPCS